MKKGGSIRVAVAILVSGLLIGGTGGAIAGDQIGTDGIGTEPSPPRSSPMALSRRRKSGTGPSRATISPPAPRAPGSSSTSPTARWWAPRPRSWSNCPAPGTPPASPTARGACSWCATAGRGAPSFFFMLSQSAPAGENANNGFFIVENSFGTAMLDQRRVLQPDRHDPHHPDGQDGVARRRLGDPTRARGALVDEQHRASGRLTGARTPPGIPDGRVALGRAFQLFGLAARSGARSPGSCSSAQTAPPTQPPLAPGSAPSSSSERVDAAAIRTCGRAARRRGAGAGERGNFALTRR